MYIKFLWVPKLPYVQKPQVQNRVSRHGSRRSAEGDLLVAKSLLEICFVVGLGLVFSSSCQNKKKEDSVHFEMQVLIGNVGS